ncbi:MAG TPA: hypothetical protein VI451_11940 [Anaerolineales bacterium]|nr:hypothetical protein [Anaerolineales bacterium]
MQDFTTRPRPLLAATCDKCGEIVPPENSILHLEELINGPIIGGVRDRHLFPIKNCEGSPSRVKLIECNEKYAAAYGRMKKSAKNVV